MQASLSRLMVATRKYGKNYDMKAKSKEGSTLVWLAESSGKIYALTNLVNKYRTHLLTDTDPDRITESHRDRPTTYWNPLRQDPIQDLTKTHPRFPLIMWGSMPLMTVSTAVKTVLHSAEVVHVSHESRLSLAAGYPLYGRNTLTHFRDVR